jgi:subtilisin family serine protease
MVRALTCAGLFSTVVLAACDRPSEVLVPEAETPTAVLHDGVIGAGVLEAVRSGASPRVVVAFDAGAPATVHELRTSVASAQSALLAGYGDADLTVTRRYAAVPAMAVAVRNEAALQRLASEPNVLRIDLDVGGTGSATTNVTTIGAPQRHAVGNEGEGVVVALLDTGIDTDHPDLVDDVIAQACFGDADGWVNGVGFCPNGSDRQVGAGAAEDNAGHGTHVAGIITSRGTLGTPGVAPGAGIVAVKVLDGCSFSGCFSYFSEIVAALDYLIANRAKLGVRVVNMSLGTGAQFYGECDTSTSYTMAAAAAVATLRALGVVLVASAGNSGSGSTMPAPACLSGVVAVGATDNVDHVAGFSQSNGFTDVFAPGVAIASLSRFGGLTYASGTSMAAPHVAGCAALLIQAGDATTPHDVERRLGTSQVQVRDGTNGLIFPRLDCSPDTQQPPRRRPRRSGQNGGVLVDTGVTGSSR